MAGAENIKNGFRSYREMCSVCHTPPGGADSPIAQGLNPSPPNLAVAREHDMSDAEIFWLIKNGSRMTGMPAWGLTHDDAEIWDIVAFVKTLPTIDATEYQQLDRNTSAGHGHSGADTENRNQDRMGKPTMNHSVTKAQPDSHMGSSIGHDSGEAPSHDEVIHEAAPIEYINSGAHAH